MEKVTRRLFCARTALLAFLVSAACVGGLCVNVFAAKSQSEQLTAHLTVWKIVEKDGQESHASADKVDPGDVLAYQVEYHNITDKALSNIQAKLPIPDQMEFVPDSANPKNVAASLDGKKFASVPLYRRTVVDGKKGVEKVPYSEYRYLRWNIATLDAGKSVTVSVRMKVKK